MCFSATARNPCLSASADDFSSLFDFLPIGAYRSLADGTLLRANPALARLNGYAAPSTRRSPAPGSAWR